MGRVGIIHGRASLLTAGTHGRGTVTGNWSAWSTAAIDAARAGIERSIQHAYVGDGSVKGAVGSGGVHAGMADGSVRKLAGGGLAPSAGLLLPAAQLRTDYDFSADMHRKLVSGGVPPQVAAAFAEVTAETVYGWAGGLRLSGLSERSLPYPLARATSTEQWRLAPPAIQARLQERLLLPASDPAAAAALHQFANWLASALTRWQAGASLTKLGGVGAVSGPHV